MEKKNEEKRKKRRREMVEDPEGYYDMGTPTLESLRRGSQREKTQ